MEATRLAPAGRACSKFIWQQCRFQKNWAVRVLPRSGRPAFLVVPKLWRDRSRTGAEPEFDFGFDVSLRAHRVGRFGAAMRFNPAQTTMRHSCVAKENGPDPRTGFRVVAWPRCRRDWASLLAGGIWRDGGVCDSELIACASRRRWRAASVSARGGRNSLANSKRSRVNSAQQARWLGNVLPPRWVSAFKTRNLLLSATE